jgi:hypothetical protein
MADIRSRVTRFRVTNFFSRGFDLVGRFWLHPGLIAITNKYSLLKIVKYCIEVQTFAALILACFSCTHASGST